MFKVAFKTRETPPTALRKMPRTISIKYLTARVVAEVSHKSIQFVRTFRFVPPERVIRMVLLISYKRNMRNFSECSWKVRDETRKNRIFFAIHTLIISKKRRRTFVVHRHVLTQKHGHHASFR